MVTLKTLIFSSFKLWCIGSILLTTSFVSYAQDTDRIKKLEQDIQELRARVSNLEANKGNTINNASSNISTGGRQSIANWRKLESGMSPTQVRYLLGEPQRIDGGELAFWHYQNGGLVRFMRGKLHGWVEPD